jgi:hypothetical protein
MEEHPRWTVAAIWVGLLWLAVPPHGVSLLFAGLVITAATRWALRS